MNWTEETTSIKLTEKRGHGETGGTVSFLVQFRECVYREKRSGSDQVQAIKHLMCWLYEVGLHLKINEKLWSSFSHGNSFNRIMF